MTEPAGLTPEQEAVRRLLAEARHDGPTPPEVVARLDDTLASLVAERDSGRDAEREETLPTRDAPVVDLGARRRRRAGIGLLAAAAVVVAGVAIGEGLPRTSSSNDAGSAAGGDTTASESRDFGAEDDSSGGAGADGGSAEAGPESLKSSAAAPEAAVPHLSTADADLDQELRRLRSRAAQPHSTLDSAEPDPSCLRGIGPGRRLAADVDGEAGLVVFRRADGERQRVDLYVCDVPRPARTLTLPAP